MSGTLKRTITEEPSMLLRVCCLITLAGLLLNPLPIRSADEKPAPVKQDETQDKGFFPTPINYSQPDWALTPGGFRPGFTGEKRDSMGSFAYPGSDSTQTYTCAVAATAAKL